MGFKSRDMYIPALFYADDGLLLSNSIEEMSNMIDLLKTTSEEYGLNINTDKCNILIYDKQHDTHPEELKGIKVQEEIKYLGVTITNKRRCFQKHKNEI